MQAWTFYVMLGQVRPAYDCLGQFRPGEVRLV
jgi:hypothetical protein